MKKLVLSIVAAAAIVATPAPATPVLSGHYALNVTVLCQATTTFPGQILTKLADVDYDPVAGTATVSGIQTAGSLNVLAGGTVGMTVTTLSYSSSYSNDDTTLTAAGVTWTIQYGPVDSSGVAKGYLTNGLVAIGGVNYCNGWATALRK